MRHIHILPALATCAGLAAGCNVINDGLLGDQPVVDAAGATDGDDVSDAPIDGRPDPTPLPNVILNYKFEDQGTLVLDSSGRDLDGELTTPESWTANGRIGRGLKLGPGVPASQYVTLPSGVLSGIGNFTISVWVKLDAVATWARIYDIGNGLPDPAARFMFMTVSGFTGTTPVGLHATSYGGTAANEAMASANALLPSGVWKHLALVGTTGARTLYVDGFPVASISGAPDVPPREMEPLAPQSWLGRSRFDADPGLNGTLDEFRIYDRALGAAEIQDLAWPKGDYSHWRLDDASGTSAEDNSDREIGGTLHGSVSWTQGRLGGALDFPGGASGPHVSLASAPLAGCSNQFTIAAWVKLRAITPWTRVFDFGTATTTFIYVAPTDGTGVHFAMVSPAGLFDLVTTAPMAADSMWHHVAVTVNDANLAVIYVDGQSAAQAISPTVRPSDFAATTENWLGRSRFSDPALDGALDELRVSCRAYTPDEIKMLAHR